MHVHRLIEHLKASTELDRACAKLIERSHKFALNPGEIPEEILNGGNEYSRQLMAAEIFPMPFDSCLFEFGPSGIVKQSPELDLIRGNDWLWVMAWREKVDSGSGWAIYFRAFCHFEKTGGPVSIAGVGQIFTDDGFDDTGEHGYFRLVGVDADLEAAFKRGCDRYLTDPATRRQMDARNKRLGITVENMQDALTLSTDSRGHEEYVNWNTDMMDLAFGNLLCVLGLMSTSAGVTIDTVMPTKKFINSLRARKGKPLLEYEHKVVRIDPALTRMPGLVALGGTHASPRMHWRRGHVRTMADGRKVQVKPCVVGDVAKGTIAHDYVVRPHATPEPQPEPQA